MKSKFKNLVAMILVFSAMFICFTPIVSAGQGFYGFVYTNTENMHEIDAVASNVKVTAYDSNGNYVNDTYTSICGYFVIDIDPWFDHYLEVSTDSCALRSWTEQNNCGAGIGNFEIHETTSEESVYSGQWKEKNVVYDRDGN